jgi:hypothetical protein
MVILVGSCRMSTEMVACIAVEAISILEKLHSRGYIPISWGGNMHVGADALDVFHGVSSGLRLLFPLYCIYMSRV